MQGQSPPKHRHDGTSPLPLGMDWSPPPRSWAGKETIWPHNPRSGWSYCVTIPTWVVLAKSRNSDPTVFYRVQVGVQSPEGITSTRTVLRRFNNFLKLHAAMKRTFPKKNLPSTPPKGLLSVKTRAMLEGRRSSLEEWMSKLLSDIDLSRSVAIASFLELEAAARASFQEENQQNSDSHNSLHTVVSSSRTDLNSNTSAVTGSSSLTSDYGSDTAYESSEIGTPSLGRDNSEAGTDELLLDDELTSPMDKFVKYGMSNIDEGLSMGRAILDHLEGFPKQKFYSGEIHRPRDNFTNGSTSEAPQHMEGTLELLSETDHGTPTHHVRKISNESIGSDMYSQRNTKLSNLSALSNGHGNVNFRNGPEILNENGNLELLDFELPDDIHMFFPFHQRQKLSRVLTTMHRRLVTAKADMEDLISRLNQEIAVKDYLATKVKDLEVELETTKQKSKEILEQALIIERERVTQMQWDMDELRQSSMEMKLKLNLQESQELLHTESSEAPISQQRDKLHLELELEKSQYEGMTKQYQEMEMKSKSDIRVLVKEVKALRSFEVELQLQLNQLLKEKSAAEELLQDKKESNDQARICWRKLLYKCRILRDQLQQSKINYLTNKIGDDVHITVPSLVNPSDSVATSENQIGLFIAEVQHLAQDVENLASTTDTIEDVNKNSVDEELRKMLADVLVENGLLQKEVNSLVLYAFRMSKLLEKADPDFFSDTNIQES